MSHYVKLSLTWKLCSKAVRTISCLFCCESGLVGRPDTDALDDKVLLPPWLLFLIGSDWSCVMTNGTEPGSSQLRSNIT